MVLHAKKTKVFFVGLIGTVLVIALALLWDFLGRRDFTLSAFARLALVCAVVLVLYTILYLGLRRNQSVQLDDEGCRLEMLVFPERGGVVPRFEQRLLGWNEVEEILTEGNVIRLRSAQLAVCVNMFYFDAGQVFQLIDQHCKRNAEGQFRQTDTG